MPRGTGAVNDRRIGRNGRQFASRFTRSQENLAENAGRTVNSSTWSWLVGTPVSDSIPCPHTRRSSRLVGQAPRAAQHDDRELRLVGGLELLGARAAEKLALGDRRHAPVLEQRQQITVDEVLARVEQLQPLVAGDQLDRDLLGDALGVAVSVLDDRVRLGRRVQPEDEDLLLVHQIVAVGQILDDRGAAGREREGAGFDRLAVDGLEAGLTVKLQRTPAGKSRSKSNTQFFWSAQRAVPFSGQSMSNGSGRRGSPNGTMTSEKRAATCRTPLTSPCGEKKSTFAANPDAGKRSNATARTRSVTVMGSPSMASRPQGEEATLS